MCTFMIGCVDDGGKKGKDVGFGVVSGIQECVLGGFSTGGGRAVTVKASSLKKAERLMAECAEAPDFVGPSPDQLGSTNTKEKKIKFQDVNNDIENNQHNLNTGGTHQQTPI